MMSQQEEQQRCDEATRQDLEERRLQLEEQKYNWKESVWRERLPGKHLRHAAATALDKAAEVSRPSPERNALVTTYEDVEMYLAGSEKRMNSLEIPHDRYRG
jgi:hypothetical protein